MVFWGRKKKKAPPKIGDFVFFISLAVVGAFFFSTLIAFPFHLLTYDFNRGFVFVFGVFLGGVFARYILRAHLSVLIHEFKHMIVAILAGNRALGLRIARKEGHFEYEYSEETKSYNAFISLAPYYALLFTLIAIICGLLLLRDHPRELLLLIGFGYGLDLVTCIRDISPHQTDFSSLNGGFLAGILYVLFFHGTIAMCLFTWVFSGLFGLESLLGSVFALWSGYVPEGLRGVLSK